MEQLYKQLCNLHSNDLKYELYCHLDMTDSLWNNQSHQSDKLIPV